MVQNFKFKQNDTYGSVDYTLLNNDGTPFNIPSDATVSLYVGDRTFKNLLINKSASIVDFTSGQVSYSLQEGDLLSDGDFIGEFRVTFSNGDVKSFPQSGYLNLHIEQSINNGDSQVLIKITEIQDFEDSITETVNSQIARVNNLITATPQPSEVVDARTDASGKSYTVLGDRLNNTDAQLADNTQQIKDRSYSATDKQFSAKFDGVTDDTVALQSFFDYITLNGLKGELPTGRTALISSPIKIQSQPNWEIIGSHSTIKQLTDNQPIFNFISTPSYSNGIKMRGIIFDYANSQSSTNTNANPIQLNTMLYESDLRDLTFSKGTYGIYVSDSSQNFWGCTLENLVFNSGLTVGAIRMNTSNAVPNNHVGRMFIDCTNMIGPVLVLKGYNFVIDTIECINATKGSQLINLYAGSVMSIGAIKLENGTYTSGQNMFGFGTGSKVKIGQFNLGGNSLVITPSGGNLCLFNTSIGGSTGWLEVDIVVLAATTFSGNVYILEGNIGTMKIKYLSMDSNNWQLTNISGSSCAESVIVDIWNNGRLSQNKGDYSYTVALGDPNIISFETLLTAPRTVTIPQNNNLLFNGLKYRIRSYGAVNGSNTISIVCNGTTKATLLTDKTSVELTYRRNAVHAETGWTVTDYQTLP